MPFAGCQCRLARQLVLRGSRLTLAASRRGQARSLHASASLAKAGGAAPPQGGNDANLTSTTINDTSISTKGFGALRNLKKRGQAQASAGSSRVVLGQSTEQPIRTRFAPSPTGYVHLGSLRTALFNNITARASKGGSFILRIEDTDQNRIVHDAEERLLEDLSWAGLKWDEGPDCGGPHGPYRQSERLDIYNEHIHQLLDKDHAYRCFCTSEQLEAQKRELHEAGQPTIYPGTCRSVEKAESAERAAKGDAHVVRFRSDKFGRPKTRDAIYGPFQKKDGEEDFILIKSDGFPTYHFANVVDDHLMKITHVIRGEEWLISTPKHVALYEAFGWTAPTFAHLGLLVNEDGSKLSKRNDSVSISHYKSGDVFPMSLLAWLSNLGSSFSSGAKPPRTVEDVADALTFKFTRGGIKLNYPKLAHYNSKYRDVLLKLPPSSLSEREAKEMHHHLIRPTLDAIHRATEMGTPAWPDAEAPLTLINQLSDTSKAGSYIHNVLNNRDGGFQDAKTLISQHPYLFWRVPDSVYRASVAGVGDTLDTRVIDALDKVVADDIYWALDAKKNPVAAIREIVEPQGVETLTVHNVLRLVGAGGVDVVSQSSGRMISLLGRAEWQQRLGTVKMILKQLE